MNRSQIIFFLVILGLVISALVFKQKIAPTNVKIKVDYPQVNQVISSPLTVTGEAGGTWYWEASFPVRLLDANGQELAIAPAQAQGDSATGEVNWMTKDFVPFAVTLNFSLPSTATGKLVLTRDNPSGEPEFDESIEVPVRFR